jgi:hypothetical protein
MPTEEKISEPRVLSGRFGDIKNIFLLSRITHIPWSFSPWPSQYRQSNAVRVIYFILL